MAVLCIAHVIAVPPEVEEEKLIPVRWANEYSSATTAGMDEVDRNWDNINASLGLVAISHGLAAKHGLPPTMDDPRDRGKGIYTLEGYHSLHCLVSRLLRMKCGCISTLTASRTDGNTTHDVSTGQRGET